MHNAPTMWSVVHSDAEIPSAKIRNKDFSGVGEEVEVEVAPHLVHLGPHIQGLGVAAPM